MSTGVSNVLKQNASEVERTLLRRQRRGGAQLRRQGRGDLDGGEPARRRDDAISSTRSRAACSPRSPARAEEFVSEVSRVTEHAVKAIEAKGFNFTQTMMDNSEHIARLINEASETATGSVSQSLKELQTQPHQPRPRPPAKPSPARSGSCARRRSSRPRARRRRSPRTLQASCRTRPRRRSSSPRSRRLGRGLRDLRDAKHAAVGYDRAVRAPARGQHPAAGGARAARTRT